MLLLVLFGAGNSNGKYFNLPLSPRAIPRLSTKIPFVRKSELYVSTE